MPQRRSHGAEDEDTISRCPTTTFSDGTPPPSDVTISNMTSPPDVSVTSQWCPAASEETSVEQQLQWRLLTPAAVLTHVAVQTAGGSAGEVVHSPQATTVGKAQWSSLGMLLLIPERTLRRCEQSTRSVKGTVLV